MCSRHRPLHGADSAEAYVLRPYVVILRDDDGDRIKVRVPAALGPNDARQQARDFHPGYDPIHTIEEVEPPADRGRMQDEPSYNAIDRVAS